MSGKIPRTAVWILGFLLFLAVFRDLLTNGRPLYCRIDGVAYFPGIRSILTHPDRPFSEKPLRNIQLIPDQFEAWKNPDNFDEPPFYAPVPFAPGEFSSRNQLRFGKPGSAHPGLPSWKFRHWLGTDAEGRDIAATIVSGARIAMLIGSVAMAAALVIGLLLGTLAGYFGDDSLFLKRGTWILSLSGLPFAWFYATTVWRGLFSGSSGGIIPVTAIFFAIILLFFISGRWLSRLKWFSKESALPVDMLVMRTAEVFSSIPRLIVLVVLAVALRGQSDGSVWLMTALIGMFSWTGVARFVRAELLRIRALDYVTAARGLGLSPWHILIRHALPNAMRPVYIAFAFGAASAVLLEAYLSFLGFGGAAFRGISWGSLFINENSAADPLDTWWVTLFPGLMIFLAVSALNATGEALSE
jgi:peptide/nickel transport system permease protein